MLEKTISPESPLNWMVQFWPVPLVVFIVSVIATLLCIKIALRLGIVDKPDNLVKTHGKATPYLGGVAIFSGILIGMLMLNLKYNWGLSNFWIVAAGAIACITGVLDDIFDIRPWQKIAGQVATAIVLVAAGITPGFYSLAGPVGLVIDAVFVIVFVLGATNSLNLLDGLDGLCAGVTAIMTVGMMALAFLLSVQTDDPASLILVLCLVQIPAILGFLIFNYPRRGGARIFMGDAGSLLLGLNMAALMILFAEGTPQFFFGAIVVFGLPILDTSVAFARRIINKRPLFVSDRGHIYDQMMDGGMTLKKTVNLCYAFSALYVLAGIVVSQLPLIWAVAACCVLAIASWLIVWRKGYLRMTGLRGAIKNEQEFD